MTLVTHNQAKVLPALLVSQAMSHNTRKKNKRDIYEIMVLTLHWFDAERKAKNLPRKMDARDSYVSVGS